MMQLSMLDILEPPPEPVRYIERPRYKVAGRAYGGAYDFTVTEGNGEPFEIEVRGIPCTINPDFGFSTYVIDGPGSLFWSETGYRSWCHGVWEGGRITFGGGVDEIRALIERYIDAPAKDGNGMGGKLVRWWPGYILDWQGNLSWSLRYDRADVWTQWGPERHAEIWANHDAKIAAAEARMWAEGIDPNDVGKPARHTGPWPRIERHALQESAA